MTRLYSLALTVFLIATATAQQSASTPLSLLLGQHKTALDAIERERLAKVAELDPKYEAALDRIKKQHQDEKDFDAVLAVAFELKNYTDPPAPDAEPAPGKVSPELAKAKRTYRISIAKIQSEIDPKTIAETEDSIAKLRSLAAKYASTDKLDDAVATDNARKELESSADYTAALARLKSAPQRFTDLNGSLQAGLPRHGLTAHYGFDGNLANTQPDGPEISHSGKKNYASGLLGRALVIDNGRGMEKNYVDFPLPEDGKSSFTISFCLQVDMGPHSTRALLGIGDAKESDTLRFEFQREGGDNAAVYTYRDGEHIGGASGGATRPEKEWRHILITVEPDLINYYVNGRIMTSAKIDTPFDLTAMSAHLPMCYYKRRTDDGGRELAKDAGMDALIDELTIWDRVLRSNEIKDVVKLYRLGESP